MADFKLLLTRRVEGYMKAKNRKRDGLIERLTIKSKNIFENTSFYNEYKILEILKFQKYLKSNCWITPVLTRFVIKKLTYVVNVCRVL